MEAKFAILNLKVFDGNKLNFSMWFERVLGGIRASAPNMKALAGKGPFAGLKYDPDAIMDDIPLTPGISPASQQARLKTPVVNLNRKFKAVGSKGKKGADHKKETVERDKTIETPEKKTELKLTGTSCKHYSITTVRKCIISL